MSNRFLPLDVDTIYYTFVLKKIHSHSHTKAGEKRIYAPNLFPLALKVIIILNAHYVPSNKYNRGGSGYSVPNITFKNVLSLYLFD